MRIRPQMLNELLEKDKLLICENCGRILSRGKKNAPVEQDKASAPKS